MTTVHPSTPVGSPDNVQAEHSGGGCVNDGSMILLPKVTKVSVSQVSTQPWSVVQFRLLSSASILQGRCFLSAAPYNVVGRWSPYFKTRHGSGVVAMIPSARSELTFFTGDD
ncbi:hypothetical protein BRADI_3g53886v3 [Brachypodium distachyon]|uniref:Uncharacterized protein n=1 Tax=Brachypodium distachyon TaxID=15368 RepID=A0A2K2D4X5_BRADI|nr:hypothetical protein BRADI_3g53886v3 [Brachypodium distachyon]